jgi:hypothetical protein
MMLFFWGLSVMSLLSAGYLWGARRGLHARDALRAEYAATVATLAQKAEGQDANRRAAEALGLREMLGEMLAPVIDRQRLGRDFSQLEGGSGLRELPGVLDAIARKGGFSAVVLSDDVGLPLATSSGARDAETLAGVSSLLLTLADRCVTTGAPRPIAVLVHDESNQRILHRIFSVGPTRFLLTAVARGLELAPQALDPALGKLEQVLTRQEPS